MANSLAIGPAVMINRMVDRSGVSQNASLAKVAELRMALQVAMQQEAAASALRSPDGKAKVPVVDSGAVVDLLI
jgi:hypothetical protein